MIDLIKIKRVKFDLNWIRRLLGFITSEGRKARPDDFRETFLGHKQWLEERDAFIASMSHGQAVKPFPNKDACMKLVSDLAKHPDMAVTRSSIAAIVDGIVNIEGMDMTRALKAIARYLHERRPWAVARGSGDIDVDLEESDNDEEDILGMVEYTWRGDTSAVGFLEEVTNVLGGGDAFMDTDTAQLFSPDPVARYVALQNHLSFHVEWFREFAELSTGSSSSAIMWGGVHAAIDSILCNRRSTDAALDVAIARKLFQNVIFTSRTNIVC